MTLEEARQNVGSKVMYTPFQGCKPSIIEYGIITGVNQKFVFVRYGNENISKATNSAKLKLECKEAIRMPVTREEYPDIFRELDWLEDQLEEEFEDEATKGKIEWLIDSITLSLESILEDVNEAHDLLD
jgi:hypothetical protein